MTDWGGDAVSEWLWHLFHDPVRDNPWSLVALAVIVGVLLGSMWITGGWRHLPRRSGRHDA